MTTTRRPRRVMWNMNLEDLHAEIEDAMEMVAETARQNERDYTISLLHSADGHKAIADGGLATPLLLERLTILIEQGAWKS